MALSFKCDSLATAEGAWRKMIGGDNGQLRFN